SRWQEHGAAHAGGPRAQQAGKLETRALFAGSQGGTVARAGRNACAPLSAHHGSASKLTTACAIELWRTCGLSPFRCASAFVSAVLVQGLAFSAGGDGGGRSPELS